MIVTDPYEPMCLAAMAAIARAFAEAHRRVAAWEPRPYPKATR